jgi:DNA-binding NtrC family response regulator
VEVRQVPADMCPILVMASNTSTRNSLTGDLRAWGAHVSAAVDVKEAESCLDGDLATVTAILSLSLPKWRGLTTQSDPL